MTESGGCSNMGLWCIDNSTGGALSMRPPVVGGLTPSGASVGIWCNGNMLALGASVGSSNLLVPSSFKMPWRERNLGGQQFR